MLAYASVVNSTGIKVLQLKGMEYWKISVSLLREEEMAYKRGKSVANATATSARYMKTSHLFFFAPLV